MKNFYTWLFIILAIVLISAALTHSRVDRLEARLASNNNQNIFITNNSTTTITYVIDKVSGNGNSFGDNCTTFNENA